MSSWIWPPHALTVTSSPDCKNLHSTNLHNGGPEFSAPLNPWYITTVMFEGFQEATQLFHMMPRDANLSDSCTLDYCSVSSPAFSLWSDSSNCYMLSEILPRSWNIFVVVIILLKVTPFHVYCDNDNPLSLTNYLWKCVQLCVKFTVRSSPDTQNYHKAMAKFVAWSLGNFHISST